MVILGYMKRIASCKNYSAPIFLAENLFGRKFVWRKFFPPNEFSAERIFRQTNFFSKSNEYCSICFKNVYQNFWLYVLVLVCSTSLYGAHFSRALESRALWTPSLYILLYFLNIVLVIYKRFDSCQSRLSRSVKKWQDFTHRQSAVC